MTIPAGAQVIINLASANRDGTRTTRGPRRSMSSRADVRHLGFGHGIHFCLGAPLARMEGRLALGRLLGRFPDLRLAVRGRGAATGVTATASCCAASPHCRSFPVVPR